MNPNGDTFQKMTYDPVFEFWNGKSIPIYNVFLLKVERKEGLGCVSNRE